MKANYWEGNEHRGFCFSRGQLLSWLPEKISDLLLVLMSFVNILKVTILG